MSRRREPDRSTLPPPEIIQADLAQPLAKEDRADRSAPDFGPIDYPGRPGERDQTFPGRYVTGNDPGPDIQDVKS